MLNHADVVPLLGPPAIHRTWQVTSESRESIGSGGMAASALDQHGCQRAGDRRCCPGCLPNRRTRSSSNAFDFLSRIFTVAGPAVRCLPLVGQYGERAACSANSTIEACTYSFFCRRAIESMSCENHVRTALNPGGAPFGQFSLSLLPATQPFFGSPPDCS